MKNVLDLKSGSIDLAAVLNTKAKARALLHPLRAKILATIDSKGEMPVTPLYVKMKIEQSVCSQQLAILRRAGFVNTRRDGKKIYYSVNKAEIQAFVNQCAGK